MKMCSTSPVFSEVAGGQSSSMHYWRAEELRGHQHGSEAMLPTPDGQSVEIERPV